MEEQQQQQELVPLSEELNLETISSRAKYLHDVVRNSNDSSTSSTSELNKLLEDLNFQSIIKEAGFSNVTDLKPEDLVDVYMNDAKEQLNLVEVENSKVYDEIKILTDAHTNAYIQLEREIEELYGSLKFLELQSLDNLDLGGNVECSTSLNGSMVNNGEGENFELLDLVHQVEKKKVTLSSLEDLEDTLKRVAAVGQIEDSFTGLKVVDFCGNGIRLSLETFIPTLDGLISQQKLQFTNNPRMVVHELFAEVYDGTMELKHMEIFPNDVFMGDIVDAAKSTWKVFLSSFHGITSPLTWLVQKVQDRIVLCTLRQAIVKEASKSRHSFEYSDKDGTVIAHMVGGIDAFIRLPHCWPLVNSTLELTSLRSPDNRTKELLLSSCKVEELVSSLDVQTRQNLWSFVDAIAKILAQRM